MASVQQSSLHTNTPYQLNIGAARGLRYVPHKANKHLVAALAPMPVVAGLVDGSVKDSNDGGGSSSSSSTPDPRPFLVQLIQKTGASRDHQFELEDDPAEADNHYKQPRPILPYRTSDDGAVTHYRVSIIVEDAEDHLNMGVLTVDHDQLVVGNAARGEGQSFTLVDNAGLRLLVADSTHTVGFNAETNVLFATRTPESHPHWPEAFKIVAERVLDGGGLARASAASVLGSVAESDGAGPQEEGGGNDRDTNSSDSDNEAEESSDSNDNDDDDDDPDTNTVAHTSTATHTTNMSRLWLRLIYFLKHIPLYVYVGGIALGVILGIVLALVAG